MWRPALHVAGLLLAGGAADTGHAEAVWRAQPELYLSGLTNYARTGGRSSAFDTVAFTAELTFFSPGRPYWGGPFVDYRSSSASRFEDNLNLGVYGRYNLLRWDITGWLFENRSPGNPDTWIYATRIRYRVTERVKLGIETLASLDDAGQPRLMLGYYGAVSESLSLNLLAGAGSGGSPDLAARMELVWKVR